MFTYKREAGGKGRKVNKLPRNIKHMTTYNELHQPRYGKKKVCQLLVAKTKKIVHKHTPGRPCLTGR